MSVLSQEELQHRLAALDTPSIADALDSIAIHGALLGIQSRLPGQRTVAGQAFTVSYRPFVRNSDEFHNAGNYIDRVSAGEMIIIDNEGRGDCTVWGDILTEMALSKHIGGTVIHGAARDLGEVQRLHYPLFSTAIHMVSGKNRVKVTATQTPLQIGDVTVKPGDWIIADSSGVIAIPLNHIDDVLSRAERISNTEQCIRSAIRTGMNLEDARAHYGYDRPWEEQDRR